MFECLSYQHGSSDAQQSGTHTQLRICAKKCAFESAHVSAYMRPKVRIRKCTCLSIYVSVYMRPKVRIQKCACLSIYVPESAHVSANVCPKVCACLSIYVPEVHMSQQMCA